MKKYLSPGNLIVTAGGILAFVGMTAYFTDSVNLSVPTFFYGVPIFLIGLGLKTSEIPPVELFDKKNFATNKFNRPKELTALVKDVTRWRYGIKAFIPYLHLVTSLTSAVSSFGLLNLFVAKFFLSNNSTGGISEVFKPNPIKKIGTP